ncbi:hypothetical protein [Actinoallomurus sp. NPDC052274]|uniref:hypothetical protein n=1 Tax=Actinoallomurus sp. NPDC052274 TaxID=3155420 RepID=UPI0034293138
MADEVADTDDRDPAVGVTAMAEQVLALAATWTAWDGRPFPIDDRVYTPHKAIRRVNDHLIDHLAELGDRPAGTGRSPTGATRDGVRRASLTARGRGAGKAASRLRSIWRRSPNRTWTRPGAG